MQFYACQMLYDWYCDGVSSGAIPGRCAPKDDYYRANVHYASMTGQGDVSIMQANNDSAWTRSGRPAYNVWPGIARMLQQVDYDRVPCDMLAIPQGFDALALRFAKGAKSLMVGEHEVQWILIHRLQNYFSLFWHFGEEGETIGTGRSKTGVPIHSFKNYTLSQGDHIASVDGQLDNWTEGIEQSESNVRAITAIAAGVCLLAQDPDLVIPAREDYTDAQLDALRRAGKEPATIKNTWHVGSHIEKIPHYRRPHPAWIACGKGRCERRLVMRKGAIIHRETVEKIPTEIETLPNKE